MHNLSEPRPNRLAAEKSPYLLQHADNPVDWYPWGDEAFEAARAQGKPVFLSIGYSTCHWCHVMERESFEDATIAALLNRDFINIKVDREEHPDIDALYMSAVTAMVGRGGWPMTVFLTPEGEPFYGGTYFPPESRAGMMGMRELLPVIAKAWASNKTELVDQAKKLTAQIGYQPQQADGFGDLEALMAEGYAQAERAFDGAKGGFGGAPKFPSPHILSFLLRWAHRHPGSHALSMVVKTLDAIQDGGIHDHLGGGFHRYSTDEDWLVPHFEKMLYDQALLLRAYTEAYQVVGDARYKETAEGIIDYVLRDLCPPEGGFYSAEDADSEGREGLFYFWTLKEWRSVLGEDAEWSAGLYDVSEEGNFDGYSILNRRQNAEMGPPDDARRVRIREKLLATRSQRVRPHLDDKVLTSWNGLMIGALAYAGFVFDNKAAVEAARKGHAFVRRYLAPSEGRLLRRYRDGDARYSGTLEDYAFFAWGTLDLYLATGEAELLQQAADLMRTMKAEFWDEASGDFFMRSRRERALISSLKVHYDGAVPSGNSVAAMVWVRMAHTLQDKRLEEESEAILKACGGVAAQGALGYAQFLIAADWWVGPRREIVLAGDPGSEASQAMRRFVAEVFLPRTCVLYHWESQKTLLDRLVPHVTALAQAEQAAAYLCEGYSCRLPANSVQALREQLMESGHAN